MAEEVSFYTDQSGVSVSDKRLIIGNTTYSMANIGSVSTEVEHPSKAGPVFIVISGLVLLAIGINQESAVLGMFGAFLAVAGFFGYRSVKPIWHLRIVSTSGETTPLKSENGEWISGIVQAVNKAIIHRS